MTDPGLRFWLHHVEAGGGLWEPAGDGVLVVLPRELGQRYRLAEELVVTDDPDVARSDGVTFLGTGHPVLAEAAESVLSSGDAGVVRLDGPDGPAPTADVLEDHARAQIPVSHGRIDVIGKPRHIVHWMLRVGVMVSYAVSADDRFSERLERWVHVTGRREVPAAVVARLASTPGEAAGPAGHTGRAVPVPAGELTRALAEADRLIEAAAQRRQSQLSRQLDDAHHEERTRATSYYADAIAGIERRLEAAPPDRRALLEERLVSTREEQDRRLAEIAEKYQAHHEVRPYRLHVVGVPALRLAVDVRRGERHYPMELDWLRPIGAFAQPRCPSCDSTAPLVAGKNALGCLHCQVPKAPPAPPAPAAPPPGARPAPAPSPPANGSSHGRRAPGTSSAAPGQPAAATRAKAAPAQPQAAAQPRPPRVAPALPRPPAATAPKRAEKLVTTLWQAVADGNSRRLRDALASDSPAAALHNVYGTDGVKHALGVPAHEQLASFTSGGIPAIDGWGTTNGVVRTTHKEYPYLLHWRAERGGLLVAEVLPFPLYQDGRFHAFYWWSADGPYRITRVPPPATLLDDVAQLLIMEGGPWQGLAVTARALAAWWRLHHQHDDLLAAHPPPVLAAAVHRLVALRAGDKGLFRQAAEAYRAGEAAVRRADAELRKLLALRPGQVW
ncbi:MAG TPA: hypothetical protein VFM54_00650 [Micromonosporaceae bacterium]|nr:hypothetical protein [Micromonosporaceae bacterium]